MKQLTQQLGSGAMIIHDLPTPQINRGMVLVKNHYSLISAGTEGNAVMAARKSIIGKILDRPKQVKEVFERVQSQGLSQTYRAVRKKLEEYAPLGYSCAGEVVGVGEDVNEFSVGDLVACGGSSASHAEIVCVPVNLCVKLSKDANLAQACYNTLGAISMQGVRQADLRLGETCAVIGLGLLGQLTCLLLEASGNKVIGIDINDSVVKIANTHCTNLSLVRDDQSIIQKILSHTDGYGADSVIITAGTASLDPINFAGTISRKKGTVVIVGAVPTGFDRNEYYTKELTLKMSCSYGPGRYDTNYEEKGIDYPYAYVRWTEKRNMEAFQDLLHSKAIDISYLTTHIFPFDNAKKAFDIIADKTDSYLGIVLKYDTAKEQIHEKYVLKSTNKIGKINLSFIGAGNYAQGSLLPNLPVQNDIVRKGVMTNSGASSKRIAERFGFEFCTSTVSDIIEAEDINTIFVTTRHNLHALSVLECLKHDKNVYVEKPLCLNSMELTTINKAYKLSKSDIMVGFNRRFSPIAQKVRKQFGHGKMSMLYRINAGFIPRDSWIQDLDIGGGRIIGEVCHFIDMMTFICGSLPVKVMASALEDSQNMKDTVNINLEFTNGSTGVIAYYTNGASKNLTKEYFEVYSSGQTAIINDYKKLIIFGNKKPKVFNLRRQDKGQKNMLLNYFQSLREGKPCISFPEIYAVTAATFAAQRSIQEGGIPMTINSI
jgi:predicted dehydrogenase/threonine dehydrogenase-like Zn-dependent dehydrogenase